MKRIRQEYQLLFWFASGIIPTAVLMNRLMESGLVNHRLLFEYLQQGWKKAAEGGTWVTWRIILTRLAETALIAGLCRSRFRAAAVRVLPWMWGAATAVMMVLITWNRGVFGLVCFLIPVFPHGMVFGALWILLLLRYAYRYEVRRGKFWSVAAALAASGILLEIYVNPWFLKFV